MGRVAEAMLAYRVEAAAKGIDSDSYVAAGTNPSTVRDLLADRSTPDLEEWFAGCGGVVDGSQTAHVFAGRALLSATEAATWVPDDELGKLLPEGSSDWVPIVSDMPVVFVDPSNGAVVDVDAVSGPRVLAESIADWIDEHRALLRNVPTGQGTRFTPISFGAADESLSKPARYRLSHITDWFSSHSASAMTIEHAPLGSKIETQNLEIVQANAVRQALIDAGVALAETAEFVEDAQGSSGVHQVTVHVT